MLETSSVPFPLPAGHDPVQELQGLVDTAILHAPHLDWHVVDPRVIRYLKNHVSSLPWVNHLALIVVVLASHTRVAQNTVENRVNVFYALWHILFSAYSITHFS